jgi:hypothetical protein
MPYSIKYVERQKKEYLISIGNTTNKEDNHKKEMKQSGIKKKEKLKEIRNNIMKLILSK